MSKSADKLAVTKISGNLSFHIPAFIILAAALSIRVAYILSIRHNAMFEPLLPGYDMTVFHEWARRIAQGYLVYEGGFYQAPLYPYFLGAIYALAGPSVLAAALCQAVLGTLSVGLTYLIGCRLFSRGPALWAAAFMAFTPIFPYYEGFLKADTLVTFLNLAFLLALVSFDPQRSYSRAAGCGFLLGLAALARPNILAVLPAGAYWIWRQSRDFSLRKSFLAISLFFLFTFLTLSPATVHNILVGGKWALVSTNMKENWRIGNSYDSTGGYWNPLRETVPLFSRDFFSLEWKKMLKLLSDYEEPNNTNLYHFMRYNRYLRLPLFSWGFFLCFALAGAVLSWPERRKLFPLYGYFTLYGLALVAFFVTGRYRLPLWPVTILLSGITFSRAIEYFRMKKLLRPALALILPSFLALVMIRSNPRVIQRQYFDNMILVYEKLGDEQGIIRELTDMLALYPDDPDTLWKLAYYLQRTGQKEEARTYLEKLLVQYPDEPRLYREAGLLDLELGLRERAGKLLRRYLELYPQAPDSASIRELIPGSNSP